MMKVAECKTVLLLPSWWYVQVFWPAHRIPTPSVTNVEERRRVASQASPCDPWNRRSAV